MNNLIMVRYDHDSANLNTIYLGIGRTTNNINWQPALRDTVNGVKVVWIRGTLSRGQRVWVLDQYGERPGKIFSSMRG